MLKHGNARNGNESPTYVTWVAMIQRCYDPASTSFDRYGARGITVCDRWRFGENGRSAFECFLADMGERPSGKSIERNDHEGRYEPSNCRWADKFEQARNRRSTRWVVFCDTRMSLAEAMELSGLKVATIKKRLIRGWSLSEAFGAPCVDALG